MNVDCLRNDISMPSSWNYGSFYANSRLYLHQNNASWNLPRKRQSETEKEFNNDEYFRALNEYKQIYKPKKEIKLLDNDKAFSVILNDSPDKLTLNPRDDEDLIILPRETVYMIDKVVRQRTSRAKIGMANGLDSPNVAEARAHSPQIAKPSNPITLIGDSGVDQYNDSSPQPIASKSRDPSSDFKVVKRLTYEEWFRWKEVERRLKDRLLEDAIISCKQIKEEDISRKEEAKEIKKKIVDEWMKQKEKEFKQVKKIEKQHKTAENRKRKMKKEHAEKAFKEWLKISLIKGKEDVKKKRREKHRKIIEKEKEKRIKAKNKIEAEIWYK